MTKRIDSKYIYIEFLLTIRQDLTTNNTESTESTLDMPDIIAVLE